jgi:hypothetical protein
MPVTACSRLVYSLPSNLPAVSKKLNYVITLFYGFTDTVGTKITVEPVTSRKMITKDTVMGSICNRIDGSTSDLIKF